MTALNQRNGLLRGIGVVTTLLDAASAFWRGRYGSGVLLLVAAAVSSRVTGAGMLASIAVRAYRKATAGRSA